MIGACAKRVGSGRAKDKEAAAKRQVAPEAMQPYVGFGETQQAAFEEQCISASAQCHEVTVPIHCQILYISATIALHGV